MGEVREVIVYVMGKVKNTKRTDGQFSGHFIFPKKFCFRPQNRFCVFEKRFFCKIFSKFFSKKSTVRFQKRKVFHPPPLDEHYGFCDLAIMGGRMVRKFKSAHIGAKDEKHW